MTNVSKPIVILKSYVNWIKDALDVVDTEKRKTFERRLDVCDGCLRRKRRIFFYVCSVCGCPIKSKTRADYGLDKNGKTIDGCPKKYW